MKQYSPLMCFCGDCDLGFTSGPSAHSGASGRCSPTGAQPLPWKAASSRLLLRSLLSPQHHTASYWELSARLKQLRRQRCPPALQKPRRGVVFKPILPWAPPVHYREDKGDQRKIIKPNCIWLWLLLVCITEKRKTKWKSKTSLPQ